ncbi:MAG: glycosyltransferase [Patescibacteria group bacterium]|jgi:glycosyltransferase involved in cell wall biosynthesis
MKHKDDKKLIFQIFHTVPLLNCGYGYRVLALSDYLRKKGYRVVLMSAGVIDDSARHFLVNHYDEIITRGKPSGWLKRLFRKLALFKLGYLLYLLSLKRIMLSPYLSNPEACRAMPIDFIWLVRKMARQHGPAAVIGHCYFSCSCFPFLPRGVSKIVDTLDVFSQKKSKIVDMHGIQSDYCVSQETEAKFLGSADQILAIQEDELSLLQQMLPQKKVTLVGVHVEAKSVAGCKTDDNLVLVVASDNKLNIAGVEGFLRNVWPDVIKNNSQSRLKIIGKVGERVAHLVDDQSIEVVGWVKNLSVEYARAAIVVNPTFAGTGLKIKSVEALAFGKPLIAWPSGVEGFPSADTEPYLVCNSWTDFSLFIKQLQSSKKERGKRERQARQYAKQVFSEERAYGSLSELVKEV